LGRGRKKIQIEGRLKQKLDNNIGGAKGKRNDNSGIFFGSFVRFLFFLSELLVIVKPVCG
jgi:hypothetical protein